MQRGIRSSEIDTINSDIKAWAWIKYIWCCLKLIHIIRARCYIVYNIIKSNYQCFSSTNEIHKEHLKVGLILNMTYINSYLISFSDTKYNIKFNMLHYDMVRSQQLAFKYNSKFNLLTETKKKKNRSIKRSTNKFLNQLNKETSLEPFCEKNTYHNFISISP